MLRLLVAASLAACLPLPAAAAELIADGGFEAVPVTPGGYSHHAGGGSFDGGHWTVTGVDILQVDSDLTDGSGPALRFTAQDGRTSLDLTGTGNSGPLDGVYQDIGTTIGDVYTLTFYVGRAMTSGSAAASYLSDATMRVSIDGGPVTDFVNAGTIDSGIAWKQFALPITATGTTTRITFLNGTGNDYLGLDAVSFTSASPIPELSGWAAMIVGFAGVGIALRRRRPASSPRR